MNCPICNVPLLMAERQGVEIDYCPKCRGIWLDRGELEKIIERSLTELPNGRHIPANEDRHHDDHHGNGKYFGHDQYKHGRKRGFLGEIFDF